LTRYHTLSTFLHIMMAKKQRVEAVIAGQHSDHPPVSCWHHFSPSQVSGQAALDAHLKHLEAYDLDFLKVMNDHLFPRGNVTVVQSTEDLRKIKPLPGDTGELAGQLDLLRQLAERLGNDILTCTTVFNPWAILRYLTRPPNKTHNPPKMVAKDDRDETITRLLKEDRSAVRAALEAIGQTMANFSRLCISAGANGIFLAVRDDWVNTPDNGPDTYDEVLRPVDLMILDAAKDAPFNMLHMCGRPQDFKAFAAYPIPVINWADRSAGPSIAYARNRVKPAIAAGVDNLDTLPNGTPDDCAEQVRDALRQAKDRPIMICPGCTFDPNAVPPDNIKAMVQAAREG